MSFKLINVYMHSFHTGLQVCEMFNIPIMSTSHIEQASLGRGTPTVKKRKEKNGIKQTKKVGAGQSLSHVRQLAQLAHTGERTQ